MAEPGRESGKGGDADGCDGGGCEGEGGWCWLLLLLELTGRLLPVPLRLLVWILLWLLLWYIPDEWRGPSPPQTGGASASDARPAAAPVGGGWGRDGEVSVPVGRGSVLSIRKDVRLVRFWVWDGFPDGDGDACGGDGEASDGERVRRRSVGGGGGNRTPLTSE